MKTFRMIFALALTMLVAFTGCTSQPAGETGEAGTAGERHLKISLQTDPDAEGEFFYGQELGGNFDYDMQYRWVRDVTIDVDGESMPLETALAQGAVHEEDIFYYARQDVREGICEMEFESRQGVSNFYFHYPEYTLKLVYDVLESPDESQHLISSMMLYARELPGRQGEQKIEPFSKFVDAEVGYLDLEDWGLTFEVQQVSPTGVTFSVTQTGGQQIGSLTLKYYYLSNLQGSFLPKAEGTDGAPFEEIPLEMDGTTTITIDWPDWYGALEPGKYGLELDIYDVFDQESVHPLMRDFHDRQIYTVEMTVGE